MKKYIVRLSLYSSSKSTTHLHDTDFERKTSYKLTYSTPFSTAIKRF